MKERQKSGLVYRRYLDGARKFSTLEIPLTVVHAIGYKKIRAALEAHQRGHAKRDTAAHRRGVVRARPSWSATALADVLGITEARVRQIRKELG